ncbi:class I SAM-dependent methyltransferase [Pectobacterium cacticida]|uniref:class I SAM-dependent methyltransferase n=1 Tax=Pectobacterium cacticida TaxID=69221 RepID=UPI002FF3553C
MSNSKLLVFPYNLPEAEECVNLISSMGIDTIFATSDIAYLNDGVFSLPYITNEGFDEAFKTLLLNEHVLWIYSPHSAVLSYLKSLKVKMNLDIHICNEPQHKQICKKFDKVYYWAEFCMKGEIPGVKFIYPELKLHQYAGLLINYNNIPGQSDERKLRMLCFLFRSIPQGDLVEIGSLWGRFAYAMAWLAAKYNIGNVISVDPWSYEFINDQGQQAELVNKLAKDMDYDNIFKGFMASIATLDNINYIRLPSVLAGEEYKICIDENKLTTPEFGDSQLTGKISLLHIDGNHKYENVINDIQTWLPYVQDEGWILLDDYDWAFGDGPKRAGNELIGHPRVKFHFVDGDTLYIKL